VEARRPAPPSVPDAAAGPVPEPGAVVTVAPGIRRITVPNPGLMTGPGTNTYLIGHRDVVVVDPGPAHPGHRRAVIEAVGSGTLCTVAVTHTHRDHAPGARSLAEASGAEVVGFAAREGFDPDRSAVDGTVLSTDAGPLVALHTPGHAGDHLCWMHRTSGVLLTGDHVMEGSTVVIRPPDGNVGRYLSSLGRVLDPPSEVGVPAALAPGHGRLIVDPAAVIEGIRAHRLSREARVAEALSAARSATVDDLLSDVYDDVGPAQLPVARLSLWAHLEHLAEEGAALPDPGGLAGTWLAN